MKCSYSVKAALALCDITASGAVTGLGDDFPKMFPMFTSQDVETAIKQEKENRKKPLKDRGLFL